MVKHVYATVNVTGNWVWDGLPLPSDVQWRKEGYLSQGKLWVGVAQNTCELRQQVDMWAVCVHILCILWGSVWLGAGLCIHLVFLVDKNRAQEKAKSALCSDCFLILIVLEQICVFKTSCRELTVPSLCISPWSLTLLFNLQTEVVLPVEHFYLCI